MARHRRKHMGHACLGCADLLLGSRLRACLKSLRAPSTSCCPRLAVPRLSNVFTLSSSLSALSQSASAESNCISCTCSMYESDGAPGQQDEQLARRAQQALPL